MRFIYKFTFLLFSVLLAAGTFAWWWSGQPLKLSQSPVDFHIAAGSSLRAAINQIRAAGIDVQPNLMALVARLQGAERGIKAGSYSVETGVTARELLDKLISGKVTQSDLTLVEGKTFSQWRSRLDAHPDLTHDTLGLTETQIIKQLGLNTPSLEGWLYPDTYFFDKHSSDLALLARAVRAMQAKLNSEWAQRAANLPYKTPYEALIMASIVEKETGRDADRGLVAAVFVNRLRKGMLLQTDPTVIYGMGDHFDGNLRKGDLQTDTPYNTYLRVGLPPTPIAMPGLASLHAALNPAPSDVLYFVARGDGSSEFSRTLPEHNNAVNLYQRRGK